MEITYTYTHIQHSTNNTAKTMKNYMYRHQHTHTKQNWKIIIKYCNLVFRFYVHFCRSNGFLWISNCFFLFFFSFFSCFFFVVYFFLRRFCFCVSLAFFVCMFCSDVSFIGFILTPLSIINFTNWPTQKTTHTKKNVSGKNYRFLVADYVTLCAILILNWFSTYIHRTLNR